MLSVPIACQPKCKGLGVIMTLSCCQSGGSWIASHCTIFGFGMGHFHELHPNPPSWLNTRTRESPEILLSGDRNRTLTLPKIGRPSAFAFFWLAGKTATSGQLQGGAHSGRVRRSAATRCGTADRARDKTRIKTHQKTRMKTTSALCYF